MDHDWDRVPTQAAPEIPERPDRWAEVLTDAATDALLATAGGKALLASLPLFAQRETVRLLVRLGVKRGITLGLTAARMENEDAAAAQAAEGG